VQIDLKDIGLPRQCLEMVGRIYNHPNTNKHTKEFIRFELQRIMGREYDVKEYLKQNKFKV
jgi:hypothetical protein